MTIRTLTPFAWLLPLALAACENAGDDDTTDDDTDGVDTDDTTDTDVVDTDDTDVVDTDAQCIGDNDFGECWSADCDLPDTPGADSLKFLNNCANAGGVGFDNAARIPSATWTPGTPLPTIP